MAAVLKTAWGASPSWVRLPPPQPLAFAKATAKLHKTVFYTYVLKQEAAEHYYVGSTSDLKRRLQEHNNGSTRSTAGRVWELYCYFAFNNERTAKIFEVYLKGGSVRSFCKKHFGFKVDEA